MERWFVSQRAVGIDVESLEDGAPDFPGVVALSQKVESGFWVNFAKGADWVVRPTALLKIVSRETFSLDRQPGEELILRFYLGFPD